MGRGQQAAGDRPPGAARSRACRPSLFGGRALQRGGHHRAGRRGFHETGEARSSRGIRQPAALACAGHGASERQGMKITIVGSGDAFGSGGRFNTCFRIETLGRDLLLDCGASSLPALKAQGVEPNAIDGVILSHLHGDHFGGLVFLLMDAHFLSRRTRPLLIAGPPGTRARLDAALEVFFPRSTSIPWRYPWHVVEIAPGEPAEFLGFSVQTTEVIHQSGAPSTAVRISDRERVLAY